LAIEIDPRAKKLIAAGDDAHLRIGLQQGEQFEEAPPVGRAGKRRGYFDQDVLCGDDRLQAPGQGDRPGMVLIRRVHEPEKVGRVRERTHGWRFGVP
jgi:hypothetical protein